MDKPKIKLPQGTGVYETIAVVGQRPAFLDLHLARLARGAEWLGIQRARERMSQVILQKLGACPPEPTAMRAEAPGHGIPNATIWPRRRDITDGPVGVHFPKTGKARGAEDTIKHNLRASKIVARNEAKSAGCWDALVLNDKGIAAEATIANIFVVIGGRLATPGDDLFPLPGVVRAIVLEEAQKLGLAVEFRGLAAADLPACQEFFFTNSLAGVLAADFAVAPDGSRVDFPSGRDVSTALARAFASREEEDLRSAPGPAEVVAG
jgi:branched-subunit amino acid aminotransferase/4-amino-4-deoxychorismate lyase